MLTAEDKKFELNENYRELMGAVINRACLDYEKWKVLERKHKCSHKIRMRGETAYKFLMDPDNPYCAVFGIDGSSLIHKIDENIKKYGKGMMTDIEWDTLEKEE